MPLLFCPRISKPNQSSSTSKYLRSWYTSSLLIHFSSDLADEFSGGSNDWGFAELNAKYSYVIELRDRGQYGFLLPEDQIIPCGEENYAATLALAEYVLDNDF